jgi:hypothetical protein
LIGWFIFASGVFLALESAFLEGLAFSGEAGCDDVENAATAT